MYFLPAQVGFLPLKNRPTFAGEEEIATGDIKPYRLASRSRRASQQRFAPLQHPLDGSRTDVELVGNQTNAFALIAL